MESVGGGVRLSAAPPVPDRFGSSENMEYRHFLSVSHTSFTVMSLSKTVPSYLFLCCAVTISELKLCFGVLNVPICR